MPRQKTTPATAALPTAPTEWLVVSYLPVAMFSLRMTHATSKGGKTLVVPTPYSVKMALLDACFRMYDATEALTQAKSIFEVIKARAIRVRPPMHCLVTNTFTRVLDWDRDGVHPFRRTIAYREMAFLAGDDLLVAIQSDGLSTSQREALARLFAHITCFGKRGGFFQFTGSQPETDLPNTFTAPRETLTVEQIPFYLMTQALDEFGPALCAARDGFDRVSTYGSGTIKLGEHRVLISTAIPYARKTSSRHFTWYCRTDLA